MCTTDDRGFTLVELVLFIAIMGIAVAGVLGAYQHATRHSADPVVKKQALAIAESLLEEIQQMPFTYCDPDDPNVSTASSPAACAIAAETALAPEAGETRYSASTPFDNVNDYSGYSTAAELPPGVKDIAGTPITGLSLYNASVNIANAALGGLPAGESLLITVVVTGPGSVSVRLDGYRTRYAPNL